MKFIIIILLLAKMTICTSYSQWESVKKGILGGMINTIMVKNNNVFAVERGTGIYFSSDNGDSWIERNDGIDYIHVWTLAAIGDNIFAGTDKGIFVSTNDGINWIAKSNELSNLKIRKIVTIDSNLIALTYDSELFISTDMGNSWIEKNIGANKKFIVTIEAIGDTLILTRSFWEVYFSYDLGNSWVEKNNGLLGLPKGKFISFAKIGDNILAGSNVLGLFSCIDNCEYWLRNDEGIPYKNTSVYCFATKNEIIFASTSRGGVYYSTDFGASWHIKYDTLNIYTYRTIVANNEYLFGGNEVAGVFRLKINELFKTKVQEKSTSTNPSILSPNPASDYIEIHLNEDTGFRPIPKEQIKIYNTIGECLLSLETQQAVSPQRIDISLLPAGVYFIAITNNNRKVEYQKFVKY